MMTISRWTATLSALLVAIVLARLIDKELYAQYTKLWMLYVLFGQVLISAFSTVALQRISNANNAAFTLKQQRNIAFVLAIGTSFLMFGLAPFLAIFLKSESMVNAIQVFSIFVGLSVASTPMEALFIYQKRKKNYLSFSIFYNIGTAIIVIGAFWLTNNLVTTAKWMLIMPMIKMLYMILAFSKKSFISSTANSLTVPFSLSDEWKLSLSLGAVLLVNTALSIASHDLDRWIVASWFSNDALFALYAVGAKKIPFIAALTSSISAALVAHHTFTNKEESKIAFQDKLQSYVNRLFVPIMLLVLFAQIYAEDILTLLYGGAYKDAAVYFRWYQWALIGDILFGLTAFLIANNKRQILGIALSEFSFNLIFSIILLQYFGPIGVIAATVFSHIFFSALAIFYGASIYNLTWAKYFPSKSKWVKLLFISVGLVGIHKLLTTYFLLNTWLTFGIALFYSLIFGLLFIFQKD